MDQEKLNPSDWHAPAQDRPASTTGRQRRRVQQREPTEAEQITAAQAVNEVTNDIKSRARGLRRLGYGLLFITGVLLFGGMGVAFYSQILLITHSTDQQEAVRAAEATRDASKKKLDDLAPAFDVLRSKVSDFAMVAIPPTPLVASLNSVHFTADGPRGWAVGRDGTVLATQNGGESWQTQTSGTTKSLYSVYFAADGQRGWAVGQDGTILVTKNGGESWQPQKSGPPSRSSRLFLPPMDSGAGRWGTMALTSPPGTAARAGKRRPAEQPSRSTQFILPRTDSAAGRWGMMALSSPPRTAARAGRRRPAQPPSRSTRFILPPTDSAAGRWGRRHGPYYPEWRRELADADQRNYQVAHLGLFCRRRTARLGGGAGWHGPRHPERRRELADIEGFEDFLSELGCEGDTSIRDHIVRESM